LAAPISIINDGALRHGLTVDLHVAGHVTGDVGAGGSNLTSSSTALGISVGSRPAACADRDFRPKPLRPNLSDASVVSFPAPATTLM